MTTLAEIPLLEVRQLSKSFALRDADNRPLVLKAVDDVSLTVRPGQTVSVVGESGCGKTTTANMILGLTTPTNGSLYWKGSDITGMSNRERSAVRRQVNAVFQDPFSSLDPRMSVGQSIAEPLRYRADIRQADRAERVAIVLRQVGLQPDHAERYPHEFSGGQRQRIAIARAIAARPSLIVLDEPIASMDMSVQSHIMNLLKKMQAETGVSYLMISHNLASVRYLSDWVYVMYLGRIVEDGPSEMVFSTPRHPYTKALLAAARATEGGVLQQGRLLSSHDGGAASTGCALAPRCPIAEAECLSVVPPLTGDNQHHKCACHLANSTH